MSQDWADRIAEQLLSRGLIQTGICLILGAVDTGQITNEAGEATVPRPIQQILSRLLSL